MSALEPTFYGLVQTSADALLIFEACRENQILQKVSRRPHDRERDRLIKSGNIFVFDETSSGIRRWTDGVAWSPSRILGNYLIYRQLERPLQPGEKKKAHKSRGSIGGHRGSDQRDHENPDHLKKELSPRRSPSPREPTGPIRGHSKKIKHGSSSGSDNGSVAGPSKPRRWTEEQEKEIAGSLTDSYGFKEDGLLKKTMSVEYEGKVHHLVSYYTLEDAMLCRLPTPSTDPRLADLQIGNDLMTRSNFRIHPTSEAASTVSKNSPTQQRTQLIHNQRRPEEPRHSHGQGYGPMSYNPQPPVHGGGPPEGYHDPAHYPYGPGPQQPFYRGYYPPQAPPYQPMPMNGGLPPQHMMNPPYYQHMQGPPPAYPPGPPPPHQQVELKRDTGPPNSNYYASYGNYPHGGSSHQGNQAPMYGNGPYQPPAGSQAPAPQPPHIMNPPRGYESSSYQANPPSENRGNGAPPQRYDNPAPPPKNPGPANKGGNSPRPQPSGPPPNQAPNPPPKQAPPASTQPLSRHNSTAGDTNAPAPPPNSSSQGSFEWSWSQSQGAPNPPPTTARA